MKERQNLKQARKSKNLTQSELGQLVGLTKSAISHLEAGRNGAKAETWDKLEDILQVPQRQLREIREYSTTQHEKKGDGK